MKKYKGGYHRVWLPYSRKTLYNKAIYTDGNGYYIKWYGKYIEVRNAESCCFDYVTVDNYY